MKDSFVKRLDDLDFDFDIFTGMKCLHRFIHMCTIWAYLSYFWNICSKWKSIENYSFYTIRLWTFYVLLHCERVKCLLITVNNVHMYCEDKINLKFNRVYLDLILNIFNVRKCDHKNESTERLLETFILFE